MPGVNGNRLIDLSLNPSPGLQDTEIRDYNNLRGYSRVWQQSGRSIVKNLNGEDQLGIEHYPSPKNRPIYSGKTEQHYKEVRFAIEKAKETADVNNLVNIMGRSLYEYNYLRPHQALGKITPHVRYCGLED